MRKSRKPNSKGWGVITGSRLSGLNSLIDLGETVDWIKTPGNIQKPPVPIPWSVYVDWDTIPKYLYVCLLDDCLVNYRLDLPHAPFSIFIEGWVDTPSYNLVFDVLRTKGYRIQNYCFKKRYIIVAEKSAHKQFDYIPLYKEKPPQTDWELVIQHVEARGVAPERWKASPLAKPGYIDHRPLPEFTYRYQLLANQTHPPVIHWYDRARTSKIPKIYDAETKLTWRLDREAITLLSQSDINYDPGGRLRRWFAQEHNKVALQYFVCNDKRVTTGKALVFAGWSKP